MKMYRVFTETDNPFIGETVDRAYAVVAGSGAEAETIIGDATMNRERVVGSEVHPEPYVYLGDSLDPD